MASDAQRSSYDDISRLVFVGFNSRVVALDRETGEVIWTWKTGRGSGFVAVLLDGDRLIASVQGYTYCLDPLTGGQLWYNPLKGMGTGVPCLASVRGTTSPALYAMLAQQQQEQMQRAANASQVSGS
ncbi:MAG TPA: PQQ-binding-like beta-propeller repeat protein [Pirellulales bacterium]|nr:PQQ-binding-like beta-propeller repeat protein [Pirellulales bacterium]